MEENGLRDGLRLSNIARRQWKRKKQGGRGSRLQEVLRINATRGARRTGLIFLTIGGLAWEMGHCRDGESREQSPPAPLLWTDCGEDEAQGVETNVAAS